MIDDNIWSMAEKVGASITGRTIWPPTFQRQIDFTPNQLERFSKLVAANAIEAMIPKLADLWEVKIEAICFDDMRREVAS